MSSVEHKIREVLLHEICVDDSEEERLVMNRLTQSILQIIQDDVIAGKSWHTCYDSSKCNRDCKGMIENDLRAKQRANLREDK